VFSGWSRVALWPSETPAREGIPAKIGHKKSALAGLPGGPWLYLPRGSMRTLCFAGARLDSLVYGLLWFNGLHPPFGLLVVYVMGRSLSGISLMAIFGTIEVSIRTALSRGAGLKILVSGR